MKDAKGHGSDARGAAHQSGIDKIAGPEKFVPIDSLRPRPENTAMLAKLDQLESVREQALKDAYPGELYQRHGPAEDVASLRAAIQRGEQLPPLAINKDGSIEDGERRYRAYKAEGAKIVRVRVLR